MGQWKAPQQQGMAPELMEFRQVLTEEVTRLNTEGFTQEKLAISSISSQLMPRYVRVNSLRMPLKNVLTQLGQEGWTVRRLRPQITQTKFKKLVSRLQAPKLYVDPHIGSLLIFPNGTDLHNHELVKQGALILQDKASCIPAQLLSPEPGCCVLDACAAPGMKTTHLAALMQNRGTIFAFDRCRDRLALLKEFVSKADVHICRAENNDFLRVDVHNFPAEVNYVLLDPPCSGSGMAKRNEFDEAALERVDQKRIQSLANLQSMMLKHALRLPSLQRLVYSTCSVHWAENEAVVLEALANPEIGANFELAEPDDAIPNWTHRGGQGRRERTTNSTMTNDAADESADGSPEEEEEKDSGEALLLRKCLRASPEKDLTNGFFVALFQRKYP